MKKGRVNLGMIALALVVAVGTVSCNRKGCTNPDAVNYDEKAKKDDGSCIVDETPVDASVITVSGAITANTTWTNDKIYKLVGKVVVESGVTLTIQPGTIVKGDEGTGTLSTALVVARGGMINAVGTASQPIIFTSIIDNIQVGELSGTNLDENDKGLWGGIMILGNAPISAADGDVVSQIEGIPTSDAFGAFGGTDAADNSGTMAYVSIRHGGATIAPGNDINGLTLGGVGSGTTISNIEIFANSDDGVEFFGGTVNVSNILVSFQGDDGIDIDMNYSGTVSNFVVISHDGVSDEGLEIDGPEGSTYVNGLFTLLNGTIYTYGGGASSADLKSKAQGTLNNVNLGNAKVRASYQNACVDPKTDAFTYLTAGSPKLIFTGSEFSAVTVYTASDDGATTPVLCSVPTADQTAADNATTSVTASGFTTAGFAAWTWTGINNKF